MIVWLRNKFKKYLDKLKGTEGQTGVPAPGSRVNTAKSGTRPVNIRPSYGIKDNAKSAKKNGNGKSNGRKNDKKNDKDTITEEMSSSQLSLNNQQQIYYPSNGQRGTDSGNYNNKRNLLYLKGGKRMIKMEGMYGISKAKKDENMGSNSDLLQEIHITDEMDNNDGDDKNSVKSELEFPFDSSLSDSSKTGDKSNLKHKKIKSAMKDTYHDKTPFSISEASCDEETREKDPAKTETKNGKAGTTNDPHEAKSARFDEPNRSNYFWFIV